RRRGERQEGDAHLLGRPRHPFGDRARPARAEDGSASRAGAEWNARALGGNAPRRDPGADRGDVFPVTARWGSVTKDQRLITTGPKLKHIELIRSARAPQLLEAPQRSCRESPNLRTQRLPLEGRSPGRLSWEP